MANPKLLEVQSDRPQTPQQKRPLSIAAPTTPSTPLTPNHLLQWRASDLLSRVDQDALIKLTPQIAGSYCELDHTPIVRSYMNILIVLHDRDSDKRWVARIPYDQNSNQEFLDSCVRPLEYVIKRFKGFRKPRLYHFALATDSSNPVGVDYMLLDYIEGTQLKMWDGSASGMGFEQRKKILDQIVDVILELLTKPVLEKDRMKYFGVPENMPLNKPCSTSVWLYESVDRGIRSSLETQDLSMVINYLIMRSQVLQHVVTEHNESAWYIAHTDLHNRNIIVDEDTSTQIQGIIDWDYAHPVPLQKAAVWPKLLEFVPGDEFPDLPDDHIALDLTTDKQYFLEAFAKKESQATGQTNLTELIATCSARNFFELAHHRMRVHEQWVAMHGRRTTENVRAAWNSLHDCLGLAHNEAWLVQDCAAVSMWSIVALTYEFERLEFEAPFEGYTDTGGHAGKNTD